MVLIWHGAQAAGASVGEGVAPEPVQTQDANVQSKAGKPKPAVHRLQLKANKAETLLHSKVKAAAGKPTNVLSKPVALGLCDGS